MVPENEDYTPTPEEQVLAVQVWMALDLHSALGYAFNPELPYQGFESWADWWADLCGDVRVLVQDQDFRLD